MLNFNCESKLDELEVELSKELAHNLGLQVYAVSGNQQACFIFLDLLQTYCVSNKLPWNMI